MIKVAVSDHFPDPCTRLSSQTTPYFSTEQPHFVHTSHLSCRILKRHVLKGQDLIKWAILSVLKDTVKWKWVFFFFSFLPWVHGSEEYGDCPQQFVATVIRAKGHQASSFPRHCFCTIGAHTIIVQKANNVSCNGNSFNLQAPWKSPSGPPELRGLHLEDCWAARYRILLECYSPLFVGLCWPQS